MVESGHRLVGHTADVIVQAWGPDIESCCREAVAALTDSHLDTSRASVETSERTTIRATDDEELLLEVLDTVILLLDTSPLVPVAAYVSAGGDERFDLTIDMAARTSVVPVGATPKGVSLSGLEVTRTATEVRCRLILDV